MDVSVGCSEVLIYLSLQRTCRVHEKHFVQSSVYHDQALQVQGMYLVLALRCSFVSAFTAFFAASLRFLISSKAAPSAACSPCIAASACARMHRGLGFQKGYG